jgi:nucleotide-binding universal stress UspA family protein
MERALVVVDDTDPHRKLLREAGELAAGVGADLVLLAILSEEDYEESFETIETISETEGTSYGEDTVLDGERAFARDFAEDVLDDVAVEYETAAAVAEEGERADQILGTAEKNGCDHVFIVGRQRSPTGKAIFGDTAQSVILNFDGPVTIRTS